MLPESGNDRDPTQSDPQLMSDTMLPNIDRAVNDMKTDVNDQFHRIDNR